MLIKYAISFVIFSSEFSLIKIEILIVLWEYWLKISENALSESLYGYSTVPSSIILLLFESIYMFVDLQIGLIRNCVSLCRTLGASHMSTHFNKSVS